MDDHEEYRDQEDMIVLNSVVRVSDGRSSANHGRCSIVDGRLEFS